VPTKKRDLGDRIRTARAEKGWKQKHLAAEVEVEPITVSRWERGATTPDLDVLGLVAEATGKPISFFVDEEHTAAAASLDNAAARIEAAAAAIRDEVGSLTATIAELRAELAALRGRA
jgi:transcriptional regulator with XRE-family HTH domain